MAVHSLYQLTDISHNNVLMSHLKLFP